MTVLAYTGSQGSGKTYEVVSCVIVEHIAAGRRVVTNVAGLKVAEIHAYIERKRGIPRSAQGEIVSFSADQVRQPGFFPVVADPQGAFIKPGDLVIFDEAWQWWGESEEIPREEHVFFRYHRHFAHPETGVTIDLVLITQDVLDLNRTFRRWIKKTWVMSNLTDMGLTDQYRVCVYAAYRTSKPALLQEQKKYEPEIYALYKSHSASADGTHVKEVVTDKRTNIFRRGWLRYGLPLGIMMFVYGVWGAWKFFHPAPIQQQAQQAKSLPGQAQNIPPQPPLERISPWSSSGYYTVGKVAYALVERDGVFRSIPEPKGWQLSPGRSVGLVDDGKAAPWNPKRSASFFGGNSK